MLLPLKIQEVRAEPLFQFLCTRYVIGRWLRSVKSPSETDHQRVGEKGTKTDHVVLIHLYLYKSGVLVFEI